jgi:hypothetical protein
MPHGSRDNVCWVHFYAAVLRYTNVPPEAAYVCKRSVAIAGLNCWLTQRRLATVVVLHG